MVHFTRDMEFGLATAEDGHAAPDGLQHLYGTLGKAMQEVRQVARLSGLDSQRHEFRGALGSRGFLHGFAPPRRHATRYFTLGFTHERSG